MRTATSLALAAFLLFLPACAFAADRDVTFINQTGRGIEFLGNLTRVLPDGLEARIDWDAWNRPPVFAWLAEQGVGEEELRRVFNAGIGMCAVVAEAPPGALVIGELV